MTPTPEQISRIDEAVSSIKKAFRTTPDDNSYISHSMMSGALQVARLAITKALEAQQAEHEATLKRCREAIEKIPLACHPPYRCHCEETIDSIKKYKKRALTAFDQAIKELTKGV